MSVSAETAIIILAAGESSRMGRPKQLLSWQGQPLVRHVAEMALAVPNTSVHVVLGAHLEAVAEALQGLPLRLCTNESWSEGMGASVCAGLRAVLDDEPAAAAVLFLLCDQPLITADLLCEMIRKHREGAALVATCYQNTLGVPALFGASLYPELLALRGDQGAKKIIQRHRERAAVVPFPQAATDFDTYEDYERAASPQV
ncbi:nucleotidyltransferase family protein [Prosthecobacter vanneervenii]|uniref:Molybdenum cofactor cytidylyltransferase n=1 Tax=Prosthecobacter vanneervenii TaxID=48466 RepID=A0A7W7YGA7_9BACT|nr:nucleotidyltransferase family protein [Prosthecobacter vanneervenii]MBB5035666.1 molybdenum cofactor cytidylyltransferase [Prosthecobacter vanneervenii]